MTSPPSASSRPTPARIATWALVASVVFALGVATVPTLLDPHAAILTSEWFPGTDTYMRMVRVREWLADGAWYETFSARSNWPYGETLHWTRPMDLALVALGAPFWPFVGLHKALYIAAVIIGPLLMLAAIGLLLWGTRAILDDRGRVILVILFALQPMVQSTFVVARPDHHSMILVAFIGVFAGLLRHAADPARNDKAPIWVGAWAAFGIWVSVEALAIELFALAALGLVWVASGRQPWLDALKRFTVTGALVLAAALAVERPPGQWLSSEEYDRLSTVQVTLLALIALGVTAMGRANARLPADLQAKPWGRAVVAALAAVAAGLVMAGLYPAFFKGPFGAAMDPRLADLWLSQINEFTPLLKADKDLAVLALIVLGPALWALVWGVRALQRERYGAHTVALVLTVALAVVMFAPLAAHQARWGGYVGVAVVVPWAVLLTDILDWRGGPKAGGRSGGTPLLRTPLFALVALAHLLAAWALNTAAGEGGAGDDTGNTTETLTGKTACRWRALAPVLNDEAFTKDGPQMLFTFMHMGPEVLYRTPHRVVGTPYHRNTEGLMDTFTVFTSEDLRESRAILERRGADYLITCVNAGEEGFLLGFDGDTLIRRIHEGHPPGWLVPMPLPEGLEDDFRVYRFDPPAPQTD